jgi:hypothetical protein
MEPQKKGIISQLLGDVSVNTDVGLSQKSLMQTGAILFITACLIILAYFTFRKLFN